MTFYQRQIALLKDLEDERRAAKVNSDWHKVLGRKILDLMRAINGSLNRDSK